MSTSEISGQSSAVSGRSYWRSLATRDLSAAQRAALRVEYERRANVADWDPIDRRDFLKLMSASLAMAGLTACTKQPEEKIVPYVTPPEEIVPGKPLFFATVMTLGGYAQGLLMESHMGRPTKAEGNPDHPASKGATDVFGQASVLGLYDPDRSQVLINRGRVGTWDMFVQEMVNEMALQQARQGAGLRILTETVTSPTLASQLQAVLKQYPQAKWHQYEPVNRDNVHDGAMLAFEERVDCVCRFDRADVVLSLDADFLSGIPGHLRYARDFMSRRNVTGGPGPMGRLYAIESSPTITGATADHRLAVRPSDVENIARAIARALGIDAAASKTHMKHAAWIDALVRDLKRHRGACLVVAGDQQSPAVHALAHAINDALDSFGNTVVAIEPVEAKPVNQLQSLAELVKDMAAGKVDLLVILGGNPVQYAPADLDFAASLEKVRMRVHVGLYQDETATLCHWHVPEAHFLEAWSDARAYDGTASIVQPLIEPLYGGKSLHEVVSVLQGQLLQKGYETVREFWKTQGLAGDFEKAWRKALHDGVIAGTERAAKSVKVKTGWASAMAQTGQPAGGQELELALRPDYSVWDGRFANNGWLQEMPRPLTKLTWDNALLVSPVTAEARGWATGDLVDLTLAGQTVKAPVYVTIGHPDESGTLHLGYGRTRAGRVGSGVGVDAYRLRTLSAPWTCTVGVAKARGSYQLVTTQEHHSIEGRSHFREASLGDYERNPQFVQDYEHFKGPVPSIYPGFDYSQGNQWGMVINLSACIGCNACVIACQAENNIPVVGKDQVRRGREMHWIRVDRYYEGDPANPRIHSQPVTCMQCENAPCEAVCPVAATVHSHDGINQMVYNRCVGTRYCSNNCPYKVRRFNFYKYADHKTPSLKLLNNPDVTVRSRGVMEKCTYCIQRISEARIEAKKKGRLVEEGEVITACQQACPTKAIVFGDINNADSEVARLRASPLHYSMLTELNTRPRTTYLARVTNRNPELESTPQPAAGHHAET